MMFAISVEEKTLPLVIALNGGKPIDVDYINEPMWAIYEAADIPLRFVNRSTLIGLRVVDRDEWCAKSIHIWTFSGPDVFTALNRDLDKTMINENYAALARELDAMRRIDGV
jgi:hypothetical protein